MRTTTVGEASRPNQKPAKLLILLADTPMPKVVEEAGDYHDIFASLFAKSLASVEAPVALQIDSFDVVQDEYPTEADLATAQALLITGSAASAYADIPWVHALTSFTASLPDHYPSLRLIGICFGHQIIAQAMGGQCTASEAGWELGVRHVQLTPVGRQLFPCAANDGTLAIHQIHRDHVPSVTPGFELLGSTVDCANHGMVKFDAQGRVTIVTVQGHPEYRPELVKHVIDAREAKGILSKEVADRSRQYAREHDEGVAIGAALLKAVGILDDGVKLDGGNGA